MSVISEQKRRFRKTLPLSFGRNPLPINYNWLPKLRSNGLKCRLNLRRNDHRQTGMFTRLPSLRASLPQRSPAAHTCIVLLDNAKLQSSAHGLHTGTLRVSPARIRERSLRQDETTCFRPSYIHPSRGTSHSMWFKAPFPKTYPILVLEPSEALGAGWMTYIKNY
jgi:hypothetical protein